MKEVLARTLHSGLAWDDQDHEKAIDRLTAFAYSERFACLLWRLKYTNDQTVYKPVVEILVKSLLADNKRISRVITIKIAEQALNEWLFSFCPVCLGAKEVMAGELKVICNTCDGVGVARYTDKDRELHTGGKFNRHINALHGLISTSDILPSVEMRKRLKKG